MTLQQLIESEEKFQPYLKNNDFTFIGPEDQNLFEPFMKAANNLAPVVSISRRFRDFLGNPEATRRALGVLAPGAKLRIYVIDGSTESALLYDTIPGYCNTNRISFDPSV
jgi:hypothetical protein